MNLFATLKETNRRTIMIELRNGPLCVNQIVERLPISQSATSQHLNVLLNAGFVEKKREGKKIIYSLNAEPLIQISEWIDEFGTFWNNKLNNLEKHLGEIHVEK